jgi:hypothetical protein
MAKQIDWPLFSVPMTIGLNPPENGGTFTSRGPCLHLLISSLWQLIFKNNVYPFKYTYYRFLNPWWHLLPLLLGVEIHRGTWYCQNKKSLKCGKQSIFKPSFFREKILQYNGRYQLWAQILKFLTRPNLYRVQWFDFKIFYINDKKASPIWKWK